MTERVCGWIIIQIKLLCKYQDVLKKYVWIPKFLCRLSNIYEQEQTTFRGLSYKFFQEQLFFLFHVNAACLTAYREQLWRTHEGGLIRSSLSNRINIQARPYPLLTQLSTLHQKERQRKVFNKPSTRAGGPLDPNPGDQRRNVACSVLLICYTTFLMFSLSLISTFSKTKYLHDTLGYPLFSTKDHKCWSPAQWI